ncbi:MAG: hypothetical protein ACK5V3_12020 [Bdellovibrionales bacterium]
MKPLISIFVLLFSLTTFASGEGSHHHHVSLFTGATHLDDVSYGTLGLEYEYRLTERWGVGGLYEKIDTEHPITITMLFACLHLGDLGLTGSYGKEEYDGHSKYLKRIGATYNFYFNQYTVAPNVAYDFIDGGKTDVVYGILWGVVF